MTDRSSLNELFEIVSEQVTQLDLKLTAQALPVVKANLGQGCDVFFRRRLSVCRMLIDLYLPVSADMLDVLLVCALAHSLPVDKVPETYPHTMAVITIFDRRVPDIMTTLHQESYSDAAYYRNLLDNRYALLIRLAERSVLMETLYEWPTEDARRFLQNTRESFFPMCIYAKEHYREFLGATSILMEKTRNLLIANEALLNRYEEAEAAIQSEILSLSEENAAIRSLILEMQEG